MANYDSKTKEGKCIFCEIVKGNLKTPGLFWESDSYMAFLSPYPNTEGFTVVIPKKHYRSDVLAMEDTILKEFIVVAKKVSQILLNYFSDVGRVGLVMEGTGVDHAHIKLIPMHGTAHMKTGQWVQYPSSINTFYDKYQGYLSSNDGPRVNDEDLTKLANELKLII
jgi:histidine triad (HIT) family protein